MKIAVACDGLDVSQYFSRCTSFMCYTVERGVITECRNMPNPGLTIQQLIPVLSDLGIGVLITGLIEYDTANAFCSASIEVMAGTQGAAQDVVKAYLERTLIGTDELCRDVESEEDVDSVQVPVEGVMLPTQR